MRTLPELETAYAKLMERNNDASSDICVEVLRNEIERRRAAGRKPTSKLSRQQQNRINQQNFRAKKKKLQRKQK